MTQRKQFRLSSEIDKRFDNELGKALRGIEDIESGAASLSNLVRLLEGNKGLIGEIASAHKVVFKSSVFSEQIEFLSNNNSIPPKIRVQLDSLRKHHNLIKHSNQGIAKYSPKDAYRLREEVISILEWFYCEDPNGPQRKSISQPSIIITAQVGHRRTIIGQAEIDDRGNVDVFKTKVIESHEFYHERGFDLFRCALQIFTNGSNPEGYVISLASPVDRDGRRLESYDWQFWPTDIISALDVKKPTIILNDAVAFSFVAGPQMNAEPTLILTLGSGIGCSIVRSNHGLPVVNPIELGDKQFTIDGITGTCYELIGWKYFEDIHKDKSYKHGKIVSTYTGRVAEFIKVLKKVNLFNSVIIGGGRSVYISPEMLRRDFNISDLPIQILSDDEHIVRASAKAWSYKFQENHNLIDTL